MALTITIDDSTVFGDKKVVVGELDFDASYPTGGESLTAANIGIMQLDFVLVTAKSGYVFSFDYTNNKVLAYYADYDAVADGALIQVPDTTDLSSVTDVKFFAFGR